MNGGWKKDLLSLFVKKGAYVRGGFVLSSGRMSDEYIDARRVTYDAEGVGLVCRAIEDVLDYHGVVWDGVGGPGFGAAPLVGAMLARRPGARGFLARGREKAHGTGGDIVPADFSCKNLVLVDDTVTTGRSLERVLGVGPWPECAVCVVDREEGAWDLLRKKYGVPLYSLLTLAELRRAGN